MKTLIVGGAGFIGTHLAEELQKSDSISIIDNCSTGKWSGATKSKKVKSFEGDIADRRFLLEVFGKIRPDQVIHAAASYKNPDNWEEDVRTNVTGTLNVIEACRKFEVEKVIYLQTSLCYGVDPLAYPIRVGAPLFAGGYNGGSSYAISKTTAELYLNLSGLNVITLRLANVYGPRNLSGPIPTFYKRLKENKKCIVKDTKRDFIYVSDVVSCIVAAIENRVLQQGVYHVSTGRETSILEVFRQVAAYLGKNPDQYIIPEEKDKDDVSNILLDNAETTTTLNWTPKVSLPEGMRPTLGWYDENQISDTYTHLEIQKRV